MNSDQLLKFQLTYSEFFEFTQMRNRVVNESDFKTRKELGKELYEFIVDRAVFED